MKKYILSAFVIVLFVAGIIAVSLSIKQVQIIKNKAVVPGGIGSISMVPITAAHYVGELFPVKLVFSTGGASISSLALRLIYRFTGLTPELDVVDQNGNPSNQIYPDSSLTSTGDWNFPIKSVTRSAGTVTIDFAAINTNTTGFSILPTSNTANLANIYFKVNRAAAINPLIVSFDMTQSKMVTKSNSIDILGTPNNASYTLVSCVRNAPNISLIPLSQTGGNNKTLTYRFSIQDTDVGCPNDTFTINTVAPGSNWTAQTTLPSVNLAPNTSTAVDVTVTPNGGVTNGTYSFPVFIVRSSTGQQAGTVNGTYIVNSTLLNFKFKLQGTTKAGANTAISITLKNSTGVFTNGFSSTVSSDANGIYSGIQDLGNIVSGTYDIYIKTQTHLQKKVSGITIASGNNNSVDWTTTPLLAGDFNNDNTINIIDIAKFLSTYTSLSIPVSANNQIYDVNGDGVINIQDIAIVLINYTKLETPGD